MVAVWPILTYHHVESFVGVENTGLVTFEYVQDPLWSPADEKHTDDRQQHANHLYTHANSITTTTTTLF